MINKIIKDYSIKNELGQGGMATVYLAEHNLLGNKSAFKLLNKEYVHNENIRKRFLAEARSMARMSHTNIIKVTDLIDDGETVAFIMEYVEGETLKEYIERKVKLTDEEIQSLFSQMLDALGYVHEQNLVHRDIKPSNFMIDPKGKVKLMDFGIAKTTDTASAEYTQTGTGVQMGTPMYMSPEQITETKSVTPQSDIYSLGVVLWQMVTGEKPYDMKTLSTFHLQNKIVNEALPETNTRFDQIIKIATNKEIDTRFQNTSKFKDALVKEEKTIEVPFNDEKTIVESAEKSNKVQEPIKQDTTSPKVDEPKIVNVDNNKKNSIVDKMAVFLLIASFYYFLNFQNWRYWGYLDFLFSILLVLSVLGVLFKKNKKWLFNLLICFIGLLKFNENDFLYYSFGKGIPETVYTISFFVYIISLFLLNIKVKKYSLIAIATFLILDFIFAYLVDQVFQDQESDIINFNVSFLLMLVFYGFNIYTIFKLNFKTFVFLNSILIFILCLIKSIFLISFDIITYDGSLVDFWDNLGETILFFTLLYFSKKLYAEDSVNK